MLGLLGTITGMMGTFSSMTGQLQNTAGVTAGFTDSRQKFDRSGRADEDTKRQGKYSS